MLLKRFIFFLNLRKDEKFMHSQGINNDYPNFKKIVSYQLGSRMTYKTILEYASTI